MLTPCSQISEKHSSVSIFPEAVACLLHSPQTRTNKPFLPLRATPKNTDRIPEELRGQRLEIRLSSNRHVSSNLTASAMSLFAVNVRSRLFLFSLFSTPSFEGIFAAFVETGCL